MRRQAKAPSAGSKSRPPKLLIGFAAALALTLVLGVTLASAIAPVVTVEDATNVQFTTADVKGTVNPEGQATTWRFQYATQPDFSDASNGPEEGTEVEETLERQLTGLAPNTTYYLRLQAENGDGQSEAVATNSFKTEAVTAPTVSNVEADTVSYTRATVKGEVELDNSDPAFNASTCRFEYLSQAEWEANGNAFPEPEGAPSAGCNVEPSGSGATAVEAQVAGLLAKTTYHLRLLAGNQGGVGSAEASSFETLEVTPPTVEGLEVTGMTATEAHFEGEVDTNSPEGAPASAGIEEAFGANWSFSPGSSSGHAPADDEAELVNGVAKGLKPNTEYTATLKATNAGGEGEASKSFKTDAVAPTVVTGTNTFDNEGGTIVRGYVNPENLTVTECHFEYGPTESYGQEAPCEGDPNGPGPLRAEPPAEVTMDVAGLSAGAVYHFRVVATNGVGTEASEDGVFAMPAEEEQPPSCPNAGKLGTAQLPECRAWEMVSPPDKHGGDVMPAYNRIRAAVDGTAAGFASLVSSGEAGGSGIASEYMAVRSADPAPGNQGWSTHGITPPQPSRSYVTVLLGGGDANYLGEMSPDLSKGVFKSLAPLFGEPSLVNDLRNFYLRDDLRTPGAGSYRLVSDCPLCEEAGPLPASQSLFARETRFVEATPDFSHILFETNYNLTPETETLSPTVNKLYEWDNGTLRLVGIKPDGTPFEHSAAAGITSGEASGAAHPEGVISSDGSKVFFADGPYNDTDLYMRQGGTETIKLNASELASPETPRGAQFLGASADGSRVFFASDERLTEDASSGTKLYVYDTTKPPADEHNLTVIDNSVSTMIGNSPDGSYAYFLASSQRTAGAPALEESAIFVWHDGEVSFVSGLRSIDIPRLNVAFLTRYSRVSDAGDLLFLAHGLNGQIGPTGYDQGACSGSNDFCAEVYSFDPHTDQLQCASCNPSGAAATGDAELEPAHLRGASGGEVRHNRPLTIDGSRVFFSSPEKLVAADTNGFEDTYEYNTRTGAVHLLSSGEGGGPSYFMEATPSGHDVFFATRERLSRWDIDGAFDLYDARVDGGFPEPTPPPPSCQGDACQPAPTQLNDATPSSSSFTGPGNQVQGRRHKRRKHHQRKRHRRQQHSNRTAKHNRGAGR